MAERKYKLEYVFIDLFDNDFNFAMCDFAESLIRMFERGDFTVEKCKDNVKEVFPKMMACFRHLDEYEAGKTDELKLHEEYFAKQAKLLFDFEEIKSHMKEHAMLYDEHAVDWNFDYRYAYPDAWISQLDLELNAEAILIQFVSTKDGKPVSDRSSYRIF